MWMRTIFVDSLRFSVWRPTDADGGTKQWFQVVFSACSMERGWYVWTLDRLAEFPKHQNQVWTGISMNCNGRFAKDWTFLVFLEEGKPSNYFAQGLSFWPCVPWSVTKSWPFCRHQILLIRSLGALPGPDFWVVALRACLTSLLKEEVQKRREAFEKNVSAIRSTAELCSAGNLTLDRATLSQKKVKDKRGFNAAEVWLSSDSLL